MSKSEARQGYLTDLMTTAVEGGINYWAYVESYKWDAPYADRHVTVVEIEESETDDSTAKRYTVTPDDMATALGKFMRDEDGCRFVESAGEGELKLSNRTNGEEGDFDAGDADCLLQIACFGTVVYG